MPIVSLLLLSLALPAEFDLREVEWKNRVVLVFAPDNEKAELSRQREILKSASCGIGDREIVTIVAVFGERLLVDGRPLKRTAGDTLRDRYGVRTDDFRVLLIGKDGGVKLRREESVSAEELFSRIDAMPMRRNEMRAQAGDRRPCSDR